MRQLTAAHDEPAQAMITAPDGPVHEMTAAPVAGYGAIDRAGTGRRSVTFQWPAPAPEATQRLSQGLDTDGAGPLTLPAPCTQVRPSLGSRL